MLSGSKGFLLQQAGPWWLFHPRAVYPGRAGAQQETAKATQIHTAPCPPQEPVPVLRSRPWLSHAAREQAWGPWAPAPALTVGADWLRGVHTEPPEAAATLHSPVKGWDALPPRDYLGKPVHQKHFYFYFFTQNTVYCYYMHILLKIRKSHKKAIAFNRKKFQVH